ncbi:MAG: LytTR family DNA-binding domain-containing protein [Prevotellaceae bacterium]|jgi:DNA-binding LytR/AlgR family response regulator|nr:LytTR family DNA-binding domain-containing protein [Prevotellaceae bacterium]
MKILIVEDETAAYINLKRIFDEIDPNLEIVGNTESVRQTVKRLQETDNLPDLIFMDIHLSDGSAFNIFKLVTVDIPIVFTTAFDEYAIEAFKVNSIDYLLKPVETDEVRRALNKYQKLTGIELQTYLHTLNRLKAEKFPEKILVTVKDRLIPVEISGVACFYSTGDKTMIILNNGTKYPYRRTLENISQSLDPKCFFRVNKQFIVAKNSVETITISPDSRLQLNMNTKMPENIFVSKNKAAEFKQWFTDF